MVLYEIKTKLVLFCKIQMLLILGIILSYSMMDDSFRNLLDR